MIKNTTTRYGLLTIIIHWLVALAVVGLFALGYWMVDLNYYSTWYQTAPNIHKSVGILLFTVMLVRVLARVFQQKPVPLEQHSALEKKLAHTAHYLMYVGLFIIMLSGYLISTADGRPIEVFGLIEVPALGSFVENQEDIAGEIHEYFAYGLMVLVLLHAGAALKHHFIDKDQTLNRMLGRNKDTTFKKETEENL
ncbi:cytochrome b [Thalassotalea marina]|uniref:Cytochrome b n=1 Tax=Thalassotalea marina TaxID=1673741 RepID=A0A919EKB3_9GAMM|nr:cytochrome b [Thalassotalea marina]GHF94058.1 cytochrome b [Thalassotalea marina]